jgi:ABC-type cobalamin/Fe3+-siderophores transport system ATPase subunit
MKIEFNQLTEEQKIGVQRIKEFVNSPIDLNDYRTRVLVLVGQAGTGKTTMLRNGLEEVLQVDENIAHESIKTRYDADLFNNGVLGCVGVTVAHKAKKVLNRSIKITTTYAGYFGMIQDNDEYGNKIFVPNPDLNKRNSSLHKKPHRVAVHDEVSMYDADMINYVLANTDPLTKIILVGKWIADFKPL